LNKNVIQKRKFFYYLINTLSLLIPSTIKHMLLNRELKKISRFDASYIETRVNYYFQRNKRFEIGSSAINHKGLFNRQIRKFKENIIQKKRTKKRTTYFFDLYNFLSFFNSNNKVEIKFGDITQGFSNPVIVKSRPIKDSSNSIILKLNKIRHFYFLNDPIKFADKKDNAVWRGNANNSELRHFFIKNYHAVSIFDIGQHGPKIDEPYFKGFMPIEQQLNYKFIFCIEGADTATNLKWVMSSNSVCVMPRPKFETWFMEGRLKAGVHYIEVKNDFSDAEKKILSFLDKPNECLEIIQNANQFVKQFKNHKQERLINLMVLDKYFRLSNQK